jgi:hypothetical protein
LYRIQQGFEFGGFRKAERVGDKNYPFNIKKVKIILSLVLFCTTFMTLNACPSSVSACGTAAVLDAAGDFQRNCTTSSIQIVDICNNNIVYTVTKNIQ